MLRLELIVAQRRLLLIQDRNRSNLNIKTLSQTLLILKLVKFNILNLGIC